MFRSLLLLACTLWTQAALAQPSAPLRRVNSFNFHTLGLAIEDSIATHGEDYPDGTDFLAELASLEAQAQKARSHAQTAKPWKLQRQWDLSRKLYAFKQTALLSDPALKDLQILCVKRGWNKKVTPGQLAPLGIPSNHECHSSLWPTGYVNEIAIFHAANPKKTWKTLYRPQDRGWVGDLDLHWDADRLLFSKADKTQWSLWEMNLDGSGMRKISNTPTDVDCFDACYLPDGRIICASNATAQCVPCWHGTARKDVANLFVMNADGSNMRRITFDQDHNMHPAVLENGRVIYNRWDYTGINRVFLRPLMVMNPDGTGQRAFHGSNSWFPNGLYSPRSLPGHSGQLLCILSGYHGPGRTGHLITLDVNQGSQETQGILKRISGRGQPLEVKYMDRLTEETWPKFRSSYPITDKHYLVTGWMSEDRRKMGIYLADAFDNLLLLHEIDGFALLDPIPVVRRPVPPAIPSQIEPGQQDASVYLQDIYLGPGLHGVPRGTIKNLRVIAYNFGYVGLAGNDKIGLSGPWDAMRIVGTTPIETDGSATFRIPANTPVAFQALDAEGKAVQLMRTWFSARPGEKVSCVGCHESSSSTPPTQRPLAEYPAPRKLEPWYGPARGFDFAREVQPVLNKYCVECHDGSPDRCDLRSEELVQDYRGRIPGRLDITRMHRDHKSLDEGHIRYTPAYEALVPYIRRVNVGDNVSLLTPGHYHADTSELVQMLQKGHQGVQLDAEAWDRLVTWIDLNGPCHGTWKDIFPVPIPDSPDQRRRELFALYGGPSDDPEANPGSAKYDQSPVKPVSLTKPRSLKIEDWPFDGAARRQTAGETEVRYLDLGDRFRIPMVKIPAGRFVMGDRDGQPDESPLTAVAIGEPFWMSTCEISNEQFARFMPSHDSGHYWKRHEDRYDDKGMVLHGPSQPALKISWTEAMQFCHWLSDRTGLDITLPTEAQWEYACRAGSDAPLHYGDVNTDFGTFANMADKTFATFGFTGKSKTGHFEVEGGIDYLVAEGVDHADPRFDDGACVTAPVGGRRPNPFGLTDMHGNVAEWTLSTYMPYPYDPIDGRDDPAAEGEKVVRGGSYLDRPDRCRAGARYSYPAWQKVHNVGFRIVVNEASGHVLEPAR
jgi:formylglycine-generating enzyme required for sulfatase activity